MHDTFLQYLASRLNRLLRRLQRARPGSVLILVVALLVLMALIGTAFISTARVDRYSATQNTYNTQVDLYAQGMLGLAEGAMVQKLKGTAGVFRQGTSAAATSQGGYNPWESAITDQDLADRTPGPVFVAFPVDHSRLEVPLNYDAGVPFPGNFPAVPLLTPWDKRANPPPVGLTAIGSSNAAFPVWMHITGPMNATSANPTGNFETPYAVDWNGMPVRCPVEYRARDQVVPWSIQAPRPDGSTIICPAFVVTPLGQNILLTNGTPATLPIVVLAADTDGDGIADAGFIRLGGGQVEGATYYGAVRIINSSAAFNASVAFGVNPYVSASKSVPGDLFPTNIDLQDLASDPLTALNAYRFNNGTANNGANFNPQPIDDTGVAHTDFAFTTSYEALWTQLASRINNPGYNASTGNRYQALPISDGMNLAYHFCLTNPNIISISPSLLETFLPNSTRGPAFNHPPYSPGSVGTWYTDQFYYNPDGYVMNANGKLVTQQTALRPNLVVRNPVSNFAPSWFNDQGFYGSPTLNGATSYRFGDRVEYTDANTGQPRSFVCIQPHPVGSQAPMNGNAYSNAYWAAMPWTYSPTKINANTGTFGQLWTAYWSVIQDSPDANGVYPGPTAQSDTPAPNNQFRSPIRSTNVPPLTRSQVIQLRSALAAVNTIDMRDGDTDITSRTIKLVDTAGSQPLYANVYGAERQPYFSALLIDYSGDSSKPYIVVELYNPHPVPIRMTGWKLAALTRASGSISLSEVGDLTAILKGATTNRGQSVKKTNLPAGFAGDVILPGERVILQNDPNRQPADINTDWTTYGITAYTDSNLDGLVGNELVLLRPRVTPTAPPTSPPTPAGNMAPENTFNEAFLVDLVPLDNIDLTGAAPATSKRFRYARANYLTTDPSSAAWHCVYPGPYDPSAAIHQVGLVASADTGFFGRPILPMQTPSPYNSTPFYVFPPFAPGITAPPPSGMAPSSAFSTYQTRPLKINDLDQAGPNRPYAEVKTRKRLPTGSVTASSGPMSYPVGGFPRRGDLLEVPFIGSYVISTTPDPSASGAKVYEMNSVTMDSVYAQFLAPATNTPLSSSYDIDTTYGPANSPAAFHNEQVGHFCPMSVNTLPGMIGNDFTDDSTDPNFQQYKQAWTYHWAKGLFDYLDVFTPQDAYLPNADPAVTSANASGDPSVLGSSPKYPGAAATPLPVPISTSPNLPVKRLTGQAFVQQLQGQQDTAAEEGQVNINTASWNVMSAIPFFTPDIDPNNYTDDNLQMGIAIWQAREAANGSGMTPQGHGPFHSIFDIMKVNGSTVYTSSQEGSLNIWQICQQIWALGGSYSGYFVGDAFTIKNSSPGETNNEYGNFSPFSPLPALGAEAPSYYSPSQSRPTEADPTDHVYGDVKSRFLAFTRISNLITTRSDSFTVYVQVQAWQNVGTQTPTAIASRRRTALFDRSLVHPVRFVPGGPVSITPAGIINAFNE